MLNLVPGLKTDWKIKTLPKLESAIASLRFPTPQLFNRQIVLTAGVFDLIHPGHIHYFEKAKSYGDILVVSIVDDKFVRTGKDRAGRFSAKNCD